MTQLDIISTYKRINNLLDKSLVSQAISEVRTLLDATGLRSQLTKVDKIEETYSYMVRFLLDGAIDNSRSRLLDDMSSQLRSLADMALRASRTPDSSDYYYSVLRFMRLRNERLSEIITDYGKISSEMDLAELAGNYTAEMRSKRESDLGRMFDALLVSYGNDSEYAELASFIKSGYADHNVASQTISAMTLSLLMFYDRRKFETLIDIYENTDDEDIAARTLVGILFAMIANESRIRSDAAIMARLTLWNDSIITYSRLREVLKYIVGTRDTERVANKMRDEVIPEIMKLRPDLIKSMQNIKGEVDPSMLEDNPEWEKIMENSELTRKMQELQDMQSDGADILMVTFSNLKQFPFFNKASNWFLPFDSRHTELSLPDSIRGFVDVVAGSGALICDSDLYSLALAANKLPAAQRDMISSQMAGHMNQIKEENKDTLGEHNSREFNSEALKVVRDLYRFFKLFRKREGFYDPFAKPLSLDSLPVVGEMMAEDEILRLFGEFYFKRGFYAEALPMFVSLADDEHEDATLWEKIGLCHQSQSHFAEALEAYGKAALLKTPGPWLTSRLAYVNRRLGNFKAAAEYYSQAAEMDPDNISLIMNTGNTLLEAGDIKGALSQFYHANYLRADSQKILRALAWVELLNGNFDKSADFYARIITSDPRESDYLNAGHAELLRGNYREALNYYRLSAASGASEFELAFNSDLDTITGLGADPVVAGILFDNAMR